MYEWGAKLEPLASIDSETSPTNIFAAVTVGSLVLPDIVGSEILSTCIPAAKLLMDSVEKTWQMLYTQSTESSAYYQFQIKAALQETARKAKTFINILGADLEQLETYHVTQSGGYSTRLLVKSANLILPEAIRTVIDAEALLDIDESGKCLAFDCHTAASYHIMRALERVMKQFYTVVRAAFYQKA